MNDASAEGKNAKKNVRNLLFFLPPKTQATALGQVNDSQQREVVRKCNFVSTSDPRRDDTKMPGTDRKQMGLHEERAQAED